ncbi:MAG TPA: SDR family oxidoreductase [Burkholderiales bacterium]|nr:SDR family oxidoreductase [Burkholderiales bacterium]
MSTPSHTVYPSLRDRVVLVSGGGSGIGAAIVEAFVRQGSKVAFVDVDQASCAALLERIGGGARHAPFFQACDVRDVPALQAAIAQAQAELGDIGVLVNNAARDDRHRIEDVTVDYWDERFAVNLRHQFFAAQAVIEQMKRLGGGSIINFGSISWMTASGGMPAYTTAKAAVHGLTRSLARDLGPYRIRANTISPGWVMTERQLKLWVDAEGERKMDELQCLGRARVQPADIANMVLFLASDDARMCTSQNFVVDAGWV